jgi:hypothetical protein
VSGLHRKRKRPPATTEQYAAMLRRMLAAYGKRIGEEPVEGLAHLRELEAALTNATNLGIHAALEAGQSPTALADALGVSRQAIYKRAALGEHNAPDQGRQPQVDALRTARPRELPPAG